MTELEKKVKFEKVHLKPDILHFRVFLGLQSLVYIGSRYIPAKQ